MNPESDPDRIKDALNSLNNLLLGMQGYIGFMEASANAQNQDTTYFGPLKELVGRANQAAGRIASALDGAEDPVAEPTQASPAPFEETTVPGRFHMMEALNGLLEETSRLSDTAAPLPVPVSAATEEPTPPEARVTQTFFPPGSLNPGELPRSYPAVAGFSAPPPIPEPAPKPSQPQVQVPTRGYATQTPPPIPGASSGPATPPPIPGAPSAAPEPAAPARVPLRPALSPSDIVQLQPRKTANIVDPQGFQEPPRRPSPPPEPAAPPQPAPAAIDDASLANVEIINRGGTKGLVMLVDDEQHLLYIASRILATDGYRVINCEDVFEALHIYENVGKTIDMIVLDFSMPTMNGEDAFYEFREMNPNAKIILSSGMFERDVVSRLLRKGLRAFLPKPYKRESLLQAVSTAITNQ